MKLEEQELALIEEIKSTYCNLRVLLRKWSCLGYSARISWPLLTLTAAHSETIDVEKHGDEAVAAKQETGEIA